MVPASPRIRIVRHEQVRAGALLPNPLNWRRHPKTQIDATRAIIEEIGFTSPLMAMETPDGLLLLDGHLRAALDSDWIVPVDIVDLDEEEGRKSLLTLDPLSAMAEPDPAGIQVLLDSTVFQTQDTALRDMLNLLNQMERLPLPTPGQTDPDTTPPIPEDPYVKTGDIWLLGEHRVMCGEAPKDMAALGDISEALILTDPPYGINIVKNVGRIVKGLGSIGSDRLYRPVIGDDQPFDPTWLFQIGRAQIIFGAPYFANHLTNGTTWLCWDKGMAEEVSFSAFELAWTSFTGRMRMYRHRWSGMVREGSRNEELKVRVHPTQKPVGLLSAILEDFSKPGEIILDPFLGSGSTLIACERLGRICYGMEISEAYVAVAIRRWEQYTARDAILQRTGETFAQYAEHAKSE
tara:strand:+ start:1395 stop:2612 length:1218 start_codon:yes stop_codon:yes gene_type:complete